MFEKYTVRKAVISTETYYYDNCTRFEKDLVNSKVLNEL